MGYKATHATKEALIEGLDTVEEITVKRREGGPWCGARTAVYQMNATVARHSC